MPLSLSLSPFAFLPLLLSSPPSFPSSLPFRFRLRPLFAWLFPPVFALGLIRVYGLTALWFSGRGVTVGLPPVVLGFSGLCLTTSGGLCFLSGCVVGSCVGGLLGVGCLLGRFGLLFYSILQVWRRFGWAAVVVGFFRAMGRMFGGSTVVRWWLCCGCSVRILADDRSNGVEVSCQGDSTVFGIRDSAGSRRFGWLWDGMIYVVGCGGGLEVTDGVLFRWSARRCGALVWVCVVGLG